MSIDIYQSLDFSFFQPRVLRKCIKACLKKYEGLAEDECVKRFCFLLKDVWNWEQEIFTCNLGVSILVKRIFIDDFLFH